MTDRDRLIELILKSKILCNTCGESTNTYCAEALADYLLANGVIVPPCKAGDAVYFVTETGNIEFSLVDKIRTETKADFNPEMIFNCIHLIGFLKPIRFEAFGKTVFLTEEEAEQALKEREKVDR